MPPYKGNAFDDSINTELMRVCKCVIPYLDRDVQRNVAVGLKFLELMNTINNYADTSPLVSDFSMARQGNWQHDLLRDVRSSLSPDKAHLVDMFMKFQELKPLFNMGTSGYAANPFTSSTEPPSEADPTITPPNDEPLFASPTGTDDFDTTDYFEPDPPQSNTSAENLLDTLTPMLDPKQQQMLSLLSTFMNTQNNK